MTSKNQIYFRFRRYWWFCLMNFRNFFSIYVFEVMEFIVDIPIELPCLSDLENPGQLPVQEVLMILSYTFSIFFLYLYFRSQLPVQEALEGTDDCILWIFRISSVFMFSRSRNPFLTFLGYWATLFEWPAKFMSTSGSRGTDDSAFKCLKFLNYLCFRGQSIHC